MASNTGFAALAQTSRDAALALAAREEELARLREALAEHTQHISRRMSRLEAELAATRAELAEVRAAVVLDPDAEMRSLTPSSERRM